jgi:branched-chain amino acid transport system permease protein
VVGLAGLLDLGYVAFYAIGAYGLALGISTWAGLLDVLPLAAITAVWPGASSVSRCCGCTVTTWRS